jgi:hypothetical protein
MLITMNDSGDMDQRTRRILQKLQEFTVWITRRRAFGQKPTEVFIRNPGHRFLEGPRPVIEEAIRHREFAWLSVAAYARSPKGLGQATEADDELRRAGWKAWEDFPDDNLTKQFKAVHLRVEIWDKKEPPSVAVAFGGTVFGNLMDWRSNLRWLLRKIPFYEDEYTETVNVFAPAFVKEFTKRMNGPDGDHLSKATIYATGHSLGGGLAQQFAYALPRENAVPQVKQVHAFDPSPVTGFFSVKRNIRNRNKIGLSIDRTYERGEILAVLRSIISLFAPPSARNPSIRGVRFNLFFTLNPISGHSIEQLARRLQYAADHPG